MAEPPTAESKHARRGSAHSGFGPPGGSVSGESAVYGEGAHAKGVFEKGVFEDERADPGDETAGPAKGAGRFSARAQAVNDEPLDGISDDRLGFAPHVHALVRFLASRETQPRLAVAIHAPWGHGKTSLMRMVESELRGLSVPASRFATTWFNPWTYSTREEVWAAYLDTITTCVRDALGFWRRVLLDTRRLVAGLEGHWSSFVGRAVVMLTVIAIAVWATLSLAPHLPALGRELLAGWTDARVAEVITTSLGGLRPLLVLVLLVQQFHARVIAPFGLDLVGYIRQASFKKPVGSLAEVDTELRVLRRCMPEDLEVVIFIDDLDRCEPQVLWEVLVARQLNELSRSCIFVLGMDSAWTWRSWRDGSPGTRTARRSRTSTTPAASSSRPTRWRAFWCWSRNGRAWWTRSCVTTTGGSSIGSWTGTTPAAAKAAR
jgi:hypothetical protein